MQADSEAALQAHISVVGCRYRSRLDYEYQLYTKGSYFSASSYSLTPENIVAMAHASQSVYIAHRTEGPNPCGGVLL